jgi:hypothetical protein
VEAVLTELDMAERDHGTCLRRDLQHPGHFPGYGRRDGKDGKVASLSWTLKCRGT